MGYGHEMRIRELERRYGRMGNDLRTLRRQATAVREGVRDYWIDGIGLSPATTAPCVTIIQGIVRCCQNVAVPNSSIHVVGTQSAIDYGTYSLTAGDFNLGLYVDTSDFQLSITADKTGARFISPGSATTNSITRCATNTGKQGTLFAVQGATGVNYRCADKLASYPLKATLLLDDTRRALTGVSLTCPNGSNVWSGSSGAVSYSLLGGGTGGPVLTVTNGNFNGPPFSVIEPDDSGTLFTSTWHAAVTFGAYTAGDPITIYEV